MIIPLMIDGFYIVQIQAPQGRGGGVVTLIKGKLFGGDNAFVYTGNYELDQNSFHAHLTVRNFDPDVPSLFGVPGDYELRFTGKVEGEIIQGKAIAPHHPEVSLVAKLTKRSSLP
jgi:hypothetical protein